MVRALVLSWRPHGEGSGPVLACSWWGLWSCPGVLMVRALVLSWRAHDEGSGPVLGSVLMVRALVLSAGL